jgi:hypothetical protein
MKLVVIFLISFSLYSLDFENLLVEGNVLEGKDVSALSCIKKTICIVASDETNSVQIIKIGKGSFVVEPKIIPLGKYKSENDIEAITNDGKYFYIVGSHGLSRNKGTYQKSRYQIFRILLDANGNLLDIKVRNLSSLILTTRLSKYSKIPLEKDGLNIEGLAFNRGVLYFGLRAPVIEGKAQVLKIDSKTLFEVAEYSGPLEILEFSLGKKRGIRSLEFYNDNLFILSGSSYGEKIMPAMFHRLNPFTSRKITDLGKVPYSDLKAEGFEFIDQNKVLIVYDSEENGMPVVFKLPVE